MKLFAWTVACEFILGACLAGCSTVHSLTKNEGVAGNSQVIKSEEDTPRGMVELDATPAALNRAIPEAMADLQMTYIRTRKDNAVYQIDGKTADQRNVSVTIRPGLGKSRFSSRIGWFGDTLMSKALAERVGIRAGLFPPQTDPRTTTKLSRSQPNLLPFRSFRRRYVSRSCRSTLSGPSHSLTRNQAARAIANLFA